VRKQDNGKSNYYIAFSIPILSFIFLKNTNLTKKGFSQSKQRFWKVFILKEEIKNMIWYDLFIGKCSESRTKSKISKEN